MPLVIPQRKKKIVGALCECFVKYKNVVVVSLDNVSTKQIQNARATLRGPEFHGKIIVGKNSLIKKALDWLITKPEKNDPNMEQRKDLPHMPELKALLPVIKLNVGLIFTDDSYGELKERIEADILQMPAKPGVIAPCDVFLPKGPTGVDAGKIDLFHKLNIPVQVSRGNLEITKPHQVCEEGVKVSEGAALMCRTLNMTPFEYTLKFKYVYMEGQVIGEKIINMKTEDILGRFSYGVSALTGLSLCANYPNAVSVPHMMANGFMKLLALGVASGHTFKELAEAQTATANAPKAVAAKEEEAPAEEEEEEEEADVSAGGLFSNSDSS